MFEYKLAEVAVVSDEDAVLSNSDLQNLDVTQRGDVVAHHTGDVVISVA